MKQLIALTILSLASCSRDTPTTPPTPNEIIQQAFSLHKETLQDIEEAKTEKELEKAKTEAAMDRSLILAQLSRLSYRKELSPTEQKDWYEQLKLSASREIEIIQSKEKTLQTPN